MEGDGDFGKKFIHNKKREHSPDDEHITVLMMTYVLSILPTAQQNTWVCSAGSKGYCAVEEMLQNGIPGHTLLIESGDLRVVDASRDVEGCCLLTYCFPHGPVYSVREYSTHIPNTVKHVAVYTNTPSTKADTPTAMTTSSG